MLWPLIDKMPAQVRKTNQQVTNGGVRNLRAVSNFRHMHSLFFNQVAPVVAPDQSAILVEQDLGWDVPAPLQKYMGAQTALFLQMQTHLIPRCVA
jgi:hypothetical protein